MTKKELRNICNNNDDVERVLYFLISKHDLYFSDIVSYEVLKDFAIEQINNDNLFFAKHIIDGLEANYCDYYCYDMSMGTLDSIWGIEDVNELFDILCDKIDFEE